MRKRERAYVKWEEVQTSRRHTEFNKHDRQLLAQLARAGEDDRLAEQPRPNGIELRCARAMRARTSAWRFRTAATATVQCSA